MVEEMKKHNNEANTEKNGLNHRALKENYEKTNKKSRSAILLFSIVALISTVLPACATEPPHQHTLQRNVIRHATCTEEGEIEVWCTTCVYRYTETKEPLEHNWVKKSVEKEPSCTERGSQIDECTNCGIIKVITLPIEHDFYYNRQCRICGYVEPFPVVSIGMSKTEVRIKCGEPVEIDKSTSSRGTKEIWWYKEGAKTISIWFNVEGLVDFISQ